MMQRAILLALLFVLSWIMYLDRAAIATAKLIFYSWRGKLAATY